MPMKTMSLNHLAAHLNQTLSLVARSNASPRKMFGGD